MTEKDVQRAERGWSGGKGSIWRQGVISTAVV